MADDEQPPSEQTGGSTPPPGLGVPELGVPGLGGPSASEGDAPPAPGQPEIVEDYYPYVDPRGVPHQQQPPKRRRGLTISRWILIGFLVLGGLGWIVSTVRHAHATPADKAACSATLDAIASPTTAMPSMLTKLEFANDKTLLSARGDMTTHIQARDLTGLGNDLNNVIHRCNQLSSDFKDGFQKFCDTHQGMCKETFHVGPF